MNHHNPVNGLLSVISCCHQCFSHIFNESEPDVNNNMVNFYRQKDTTRIFCVDCVEGRLGHYFVFGTITCALCIYEARLPHCVCRIEDFRPHQIRVEIRLSVRVQNEEVFCLEEQIRNELVFNCLFHPVHSMVR